MARRGWCLAVDATETTRLPVDSFLGVILIWAVFCALAVVRELAGQHVARHVAAVHRGEATLKTKIGRRLSQVAVARHSGDSPSGDRGSGSTTKAEPYFAPVDAPASTRQYSPPAVSCMILPQ